MSTQNYEFIQKLILMWFKYFHDEHHNYTIEVNEIPEVIGFREKIKNRLKRQALLSRGTDSEMNKKHGCFNCSAHDVSLLKPNWNDEEQSNGKYFLNTLIRENSPINS